MGDEMKPGPTWERALGELKLQMTKATFDTWLRSSVVVSCEPVSGVDPTSGALSWVIGVDHQYAVDWLSNRLASIVIRAVERASGRPAEITFIIQPRLASAPEVMSREPLRNEAAEAEDLDSGPMFEVVREERITVSDRGALKWTDFYIKFKVAFRKTGLRILKGAKFSVFFCLALHVDANGIARPGGIEAIMRETDYSRGSVCRALDELESLGLIDKIPQFRGADAYRVRGYAWFGKSDPAPSLFELSKFEK